MVISLKSVWKSLPRSLREFPLRSLCSCLVPHKQGMRELDGDLPVYIMGNFQAGGGISRSVELYAQQLEKKRTCICVDTSPQMLQAIKNPMAGRLLRSLQEVRQDTGKGTVIIHLNPPQFQWLLCLLGRGFLKQKRVVAYWAWELEDIPPLWKHALRFSDAVEVPSSFTMRAVARHTDKSVSVHPHNVPLPPARKDIFAVDGKLRCLYIFDMASLCSRKNPQGAIEAFVRAFTPEQACLTIKVGKSPNQVPAFEALRAFAAKYPHVRLMSRWLDAQGLEQLYQEHDVYLSLHRSEGYGLTIQEAMLHGLYVVATGWSGNMDFMSGERVFAVPYKLVPVGTANNAFGAAANLQWAEPDIDEAAKLLRQLYTHILGNRA